MMKNLLAQIDVAPPGGYKGFGLFGLENQASSNAGTVFGALISRSIGVITIVAFIWFVFILITGAIGVMSAGGDKGAAESARKRITTGLVGLVLVVAGLFIARLISSLLGIENVLSPQLIIEEITQ